MPFTRETSTLAAETRQRSPLQIENARHELRMRDIMSQETITVAADDRVFSAVTKMSDNRISCVIVVDDERVIGILTDKDVLKAVAGTDTEFRRLRVGDRMSSPVEVISPDASVLTVSKTMETKGIKHLPVVDTGHLVGVATQTDITRGLISISPLRAVSEIMTTDVAMVDVATPVAEAAQIMSAKSISCLIVTLRQGVVGIFTEKDMLRRVVALGRDVAQTQVADVMSFPVTSIPPDYSVLSASAKMEQVRYHRLVVMVDDEICGIVTQTDIATAVRGELERFQREHDASTTQRRAVVQDVIRGMESLRAYLNNLSGGYTSSL